MLKYRVNINTKGNITLYGKGKIIEKNCKNGAVAFMLMHCLTPNQVMDMTE